MHDLCCGGRVRLLLLALRVWCCVALLLLSSPAQPHWPTAARTSGPRTPPATRWSTALAAQPDDDLEAAGEQPRYNPGPSRRQLLRTGTRVGAGVLVADALGLLDPIKPAPSQQPGPLREAPPGLAVATFAGGCFWCMEKPFDDLPGVISTTSGYTGGAFQAPTYKDVCYKDTGHYEAVRVVYDPARVSYEDLMDTFWKSIDATDPGGQFADRGPQVFAPDLRGGNPPSCPPPPPQPPNKEREQDRADRAHRCRAQKEEKERTRGKESLWLLEAPVRKIILQMHTPARTSQCWSRQTQLGLGVCIRMRLVSGPSLGQPTPE